MKNQANVVIKKGCHSRGRAAGFFLFLSRYSDLIKKNTLYDNNTKAEDPRQRHSGMTTNCITPHGFTLIELLVVILIIGILAAIALPQYQLAVVKARVSTTLPLLASIVEAEEVYYLANSEMTFNLDLLDIATPTQCIREGETTHYKCGAYFFLDFSTWGMALMNYCPNATSFADCLDSREFQIQHYFIHPRSDYQAKAGSKACKVFQDSKLGEKICNNMFPTQE